MYTKENQQIFNYYDSSLEMRARVNQEFQRLFDLIPMTQKSIVNNTELRKKAKINVLKDSKESDEIELYLNSDIYYTKSEAKTKKLELQYIKIETFKKMQAELAVEIFRSNKNAGINGAYKQAFEQLIQKYQKEFPGTQKVEIKNDIKKETFTNLVPIGLAGIKSQVDIIRKKSALIGGVFFDLLTKSLNKSKLNPNEVAKINQSLYDIILSLENSSHKDVDIENLMYGLLDFIDNKDKNFGNEMLQTNSTNVSENTKPVDFETLKQKIPVKLTITLKNLQLLRPDLYNSNEVKMLARKTKFFAMGDYKLLAEIKSSIIELDKIVKTIVIDSYNQIFDTNKVYPKYNQEVLNLGSELSTLLQQKNFSLSEIIPRINTLNHQIDIEKDAQLEIKNYRSELLIKINQIVDRAKGRQAYKQVYNNALAIKSKLEIVTTRPGILSINLDLKNLESEILITQLNLISDQT